MKMNVFCLPRAPSFSLNASTANLLFIWNTRKNDLHSGLPSNANEKIVVSITPGRVQALMVCPLDSLKGREQLQEIIMAH